MILLDGAAGYVGQHVQSILMARGLDYTATSRIGDSGVACDLTQSDAVRVLFDVVHPDVTIHCAANVPKHPDAYSDIVAAINSMAMLANINRQPRGVLVFVSSWTAEAPTSAYAWSKRMAEEVIEPPAIILRLPGLFGLPRRSGVIYEAALSGTIPDSFGPYPAMHVEDAAEYLVRAATSWSKEGISTPINVTYTDVLLRSLYGDVGWTFGERVQQLRAQLQQEQTV